MEGGYIGLQVDIRGSSGYGREFREQLLRDYGGIDIEDLQSGAEYLKTLPYVDGDRIGIWGWSYGGLMTTMSLFKKPGVYKAGVAGAPATNVWHATTGEVHVTRLPDTNPDVFRRNSAYSFAEGLQDHLMLIHGVVDDIVLFRDSAALAEKLMMLDKNFDFVMLPSSPHAAIQKDYVARFILRKITEHFDRYLGRGPRPVPADRARSDPASALVHRRPAVPVDGHLVPGPAGALRERAAHSRRVPLEQHAVLAARDGVSHRVHDRTAADGMGHRPARHTGGPPAGDAVVVHRRHAARRRARLRRSGGFPVPARHRRGRSGPWLHARDLRMVPAA